MKVGRPGIDSAEGLLLLLHGRCGIRRTTVLHLLLCGIALLLGPAGPTTVAGAAQYDQRVLAPTGDPGREQVKSAGKEIIAVKLHDLELIDQDGNPVKFKSDVIGDRVAVVIPFYINCPASYPILIYMFTRLQDLLGPKLGKEVVLVSVTVDPKTDIPIRLKAYAKKQKAKPGWVFLTGDRNNLGQVLLGVGALFTSNVDEHNHIPITMVGSAGREWRRFHGLPSPDQVMAQVEESLAAVRVPSEG